MALQHLRSNTASKRPTPASMADGQLAINTNATSPGLFFKDAGGALIKVGPVHVGTSAPNSSPAAGGSTGNAVGEQWLDTSGGGYVFKVWDGSAWRSEAGEFVDAAGDTMTGDLVMNNADIVFEGSSEDDFETTLTVTNPTADRTITLPDTTGTVVTTGDDGTVTSTMIANGTIVNADVNASAAIAGTKIDPDFGSQTIETTGVFSAAGGAAATPSIAFTGDLNTGIYSPGADQVAISTNGTGRLFIDASGNVGVGTASPLSELHVIGANAHAQLQTIGASSTGQYSILARKADNTAYRVNVKATDESLTFGTGGVPGNSYVPIERLRITSDGKLGLGTSSPNAALNVGLGGNTIPAAGAATGSALFGNATGGNAYGLVVGATSGGLGYIQAQRADGTATTYDLAIQPNGGNVGVGTTSPVTKLHITNDSNSSTQYLNADADCLITATGTKGAALKFENTGGATDSAIVFDQTANLIFTARQNERMRIDTSGRLGLGTSSPSTLLTLSEDQGTTITLRRNNSAAIADDLIGKIDFFNNDGSSPGARVTATVGAYAQATAGGTYLAFSTATNGGSNAERLRIDQAGNVGIGTTSPGAKLHVEGTGSVRSSTIATDASGDAAFFVQNDNSSLAGPLTYGTTKAAYGALGPGETAFYSNRDTTIMADGSSSRVIKFASGGSSEKMRLDGSGRLLVGTSSARANFFNLPSTFAPRVQIESTGTSTFANLSIVNNVANASYGGGLILSKSRGGTIGSNTILIADDEIGSVTFQGNDGSEFVQAASIHAFVDGTPGANDMPGRLVFSTTADGASSPTERMRISANGKVAVSSSIAAGENIASFTNSSATGNGIFTSVNSDGTSYVFFQGYSASATASRILIYTNGNVVNANNSYGAISDIKLKENIVDANSQWDDLKALQVRNYNLKEGQTHTQIGLIAQEVELVSPGLVSESPDRDAEGNDLGTITKSVNYSVLYMKAVKALQEAMERIEVLEAKVNALEAS